jgi:peptidoglycan/LPS O-acetylase OafA/YrhL
VFGCAPVLWLGEISYSIYVVHFPIVLVLRHVTERFAGPSAFASGLSRWAIFLIAIGVVIALAALLFYTIEQPARRRLRNLFGRIDASAVIRMPADAGVGDRVG